MLFQHLWVEKAQAGKSKMHIIVNHDWECKHQDGEQATQKRNISRSGECR